MPLTLQPESHWNTWDFGRTLAVDAPEPIPMEEVRGGRPEVTREGLETLLVINLEALFPHWRLRRVHPVFVGGQQALGAMDPAGVLHLFDLRDVVDAPTAVSDMLAGVLSQWAGQIDWFEREPGQYSRRLAARIAAFWLDVQAETDRDSTFAELPLDEARDQKVQHLTQRLGDDWDADMLVAQSDAILDDWTVEKPDAHRWPTARNGVHLHLLVADHEELDGHELEMLQRMRNRGVRVDVWQLHLDADNEWMRGRIALRAARFPDRRQKRFAALGQHRPTQLLAQMAYHNPELHDSIGSWQVIRNKHRTTLQVQLDVADEPCDGPYFGFTARGDEIEFKASVNIPEHLDDKYSLTDLKTQVTPKCMRAVRDWIAAELPPDPVDDREAARRLDHFLHHSKKWGGYLQAGVGGPIFEAIGWHSGGLRSATITADTSELEPSLDEIAQLANALLEAFMRALLAEDVTTVGWDPEVVEDDGFIAP